MAAPSVTYTFVDATTIVASEVNQNFQDIINGITDGSEDLTINALTAAGAVAMNGAVTLGNATSDDITITGRIASDIDPKTAATNTLGDATQTWRALYLDNTSTDGGAIYFDAGSTDFLKSSADGLTLNIGGFTNLTFGTAGNINTVDHVFAALNAVGDPSYSFTGDTDTGMYSSGANLINFATGGVERLELGTTTVFNEDGADVDFRIEGDTDANLFYVDAGNERIGIRTSTPDGTFHVHTATAGSVGASADADDLTVESGGNTGISILSPDASDCNIYFGTPTDSVGAIIRWDYDADNFIVGPHKTGADLTLRSGLGIAAITADGSQNVGIGTTSPGSNKLLVEHDTANQFTLQVKHPSATNPYGILVNFNGGSPDDNTRSFLQCTDSTTNRCLIFSDGDLQNHDNSYSGISDERLKENIKDATPKLADLLKVKVRHYNFKTDNPDKKQIGVIAQELESVFPGLVVDHPEVKEEKDKKGNVIKKGSDEYKSVQYSIFTPMLIKAMQEQQKIIESLKTRIEKLEGAS